MRLGDIAGF